MRAESWLIEKMARRLIRDHTRRRARAIQAVVAVFMSQLLVVSGLFLLWSMIGGAEQLTRQLYSYWAAPGAAELVEYVGSAISLLIGCAIGGGVYGRLAPDALPTHRLLMAIPLPIIHVGMHMPLGPFWSELGAWPQEVSLLRVLVVTSVASVGVVFYLLAFQWGRRHPTRWSLS